MNKLWQDIRLLIYLFGFMSLVHIVNVQTNFVLLQFGLWPRQLESLPFVVTAPFLHINYYHLANNLAGLALFGGLCLARSRRFFVNSSIFIVVVGGLLVWMLGRNSVHIGASGWVFGLWSLCIAMAWVEKSAFSIFVAFLVILLYGGMIYGVLPGDPRVSFESHLFGAVAGVLCAFSLHGRRRRRR